MPTPEYHALLAPSSAARWLECPPSVRLGEHAPETASEHAEKGRLAHSIAELKARKKFYPMGPRTYGSQLKKLQADPHYEKVMDGYTDLYLETLEQHAMTFVTSPFTALELSVPVGVFTGEKKEDGSPATGTADCVQIGEGVLWVTDYKNGSGVPVSAEDNPQMKLYALGALEAYRPFYGDSIRLVRTTIVQPALHSISDWEISRKNLEIWARDVLTPASALAWAGEGEQKPGDWCRFCPVAPTCRARTNDALALEAAFGLGLPAGLPGAAKNSPGPLLTDTEVGDALTRGTLLAAWYSDLKDYALSACLARKEIPGFKVVEGRGSREWDDLDAAFMDLAAKGVAEALLWERRPVTPPALEKSLGKKEFAEAAQEHVVKKPGRPALAPENDPRPAYNAAATAF